MRGKAKGISRIPFSTPPQSSNSTMFSLTIKSRNFCKLHIVTLLVGESETRKQDENDAHIFMFHVYVLFCRVKCEMLKLDQISSLILFRF